MKRALLAVISAGTLWASAAWPQATANGTLNASQLPALSGDCSSAAGSSTLACNALPHPGYIVNNWYLPVGGSVNGNTGTAATANVIKCSWGGAAQKATIGSVGARMSTNAAAGNMQIAVYSNVNGRPGALLSNTANISTTSGAVTSAALGANIQVGPGSANGTNLWFCFNADNSTVVLNPTTAFWGPTDWAVGSSVLDNIVGAGNNLQGISCSGANCNGGSSTFGTWPTLTGSTWTNVTDNSMPEIVFKIVSVP